MDAPRGEDADRGRAWQPVRAGIAQPGNETCPQQGGFPAAGGTENRDHPVLVREDREIVDQPIAAEEERVVTRLEAGQAPVGSPLIRPVLRPGSGQLIGNLLPACLPLLGVAPARGYVRQHDGQRRQLLSASGTGQRGDRVGAAARHRTVGGPARLLPELAQREREAGHRSRRRVERLLLTPHHAPCASLGPSRSDSPPSDSSAPQGAIPPSTGAFAPLPRLSAPRCPPLGSRSSAYEGSRDRAPGPPALRD